MTHAPGTARYLLGVLGLAVLVGALVVAAVRLRRRIAPALTGSHARLAEAVIGFAVIVLLLEGLGTVGLFSPLPTVLGAALIAGLAGRGGRPEQRIRPAGRAPVGWAGLGMVGIVVALLAANWAAPTIVSYQEGIHSLDSLWYHLPWAANFAQTGHITALQFTDVEYLTAFYPAAAETIHGLGIAFMGGDVLSPGLNLVFLGLLALAAWCAGRTRGVATGTLLGGALAIALPMVKFQGGSAANDVVAVVFLLAAVAMLLGPEVGRGVLALAAAAAGLAVAVKLSALAPVAALTVGVLVWQRTRRAAVAWLGPLLIIGGFWYLRNLIAVGNPLPWIHLPGLPTPLPGLQQHTAFSIAHYLGTGGFWSRTVQPGLASGLGTWWWAVLALAIAGPVLCLLPGADGAVRLLGLTALASLIAYVVTPETAAGPAGHPLGFAFNLRYAAPALTLSLVAVALAPGLRSPRTRAPVAAALALVALLTVVRSLHVPGGQTVGQIVIGALALAAVVLVGRVGQIRAVMPGWALAAALSSALILSVLGGAVIQRSYYDDRYASGYGLQIGRLWAAFRPIAHARVGVVGTYGGFFAYPLAGLRSTNTVRYIAQRGDHGSFTPIGSCPAWRRAVNAARLRYLVTTPGRNPWVPRVIDPSPERAWTAGDPAASVLLQYRLGGQPVTVFALHGRLHPSRCG